MTRVTLKQGNGRGTWRRMGAIVFVTCPQCGTTASLDHSVDGKGAVSPSLVCPADSCDWHVMAVLGGWAE